MFDNVAINVATGLVFIYLLYSLLATTVKEFIATIFAYRGRMLERGIEQMLDGKNYSYYWSDKVGNYIIWLVHKLKIYFKNRAIKSHNKANPKSIVPPLINPMRYLDFISDKTINTNQDTTTQVKRLVLNKKSKLFASNITVHPLYKRSAENSVFFKKPAYLSADNFSDILIDVLKPDPAVPVLLKDVAASIAKKAADTNDPLNKDLEKVLQIFIEQANGDLQRFRMLVENWYNDTMDRVSGWYKKQANRILLIIGFVLAITFNVSTINIVQKLSTDKAAREKIVANATAYVRAKQDSIVYAGNAHTKIDSLQQKDTSFILLKQYLQKIDSLYEKNIKSNNEALGLGWGNYGDNNGFWGKLGYVLKSTFFFWDNAFSWERLIGFLLTAFAISLGAPFWFDLLNKFVNLRVSGAKPADTNEKKGSSSKTVGLNQSITPNPKSFA